MVEAVTRAAERGTSFGAPTEAEVELAAEVVERVPSAEMVRLVSSGTEASMTAVRLARAATGRDKIVKFAGHYHGHVDGLLAESGSGLATQGIPASPGVTAAQAADTIVVPWNDADALEAAIDGSVAAVLAEPIAANMGLVPPRDGFLELLREGCDATGALLVLDEVITGFRVARGGAQELLGVTPDLTILGKVLGGGLPLAAVAGRRATSWSSSRRSARPTRRARCPATRWRRPPVSRRCASSIDARVRRGWREITRSTGGRPSQRRGQRVSRRDWIADPVLHRSAGHRLRTAREQTDHDAFRRFWTAMLERGIYLPPSPYEAWFPSLAHSDEQIDRTIEAAAEALERA